MGGERNDASVVIGIIIAIWAMVAMWPSIFAVIPLGARRRLLQSPFRRHYTTMVFKEGFWLKAPWDTMSDYDVGWQLVAYDYSVISADGLPIQFKVSVRCRPRLDTLALKKKILTLTASRRSLSGRVSRRYAKLRGVTRKG